MPRIIISILILVLSLNKLFAADIPVIVIAPSKKAQSISTVGSSVTVYDQEYLDMLHNRKIPGEVQKEVYKRDRGKCRICGSIDNLHFDHILPFSKGGSSKVASKCVREDMRGKAIISDKNKKTNILAFVFISLG